MNPYKMTKAKHKNGAGEYVKTYWNEEECAYVYRIDAEQRVFLWFYGTGATGNWVLQWMDPEGNQIGDAEYYANKNCLPRYDIERREG